MSREWIAYLDRTAPGATQKALADAAGVDQSTVSRWRRGQGEPAPDTAIRLARKLGAEPLGALVAAGHLTTAEANAIVSHPEPVDITDAELLDILRDRLALARGRETSGATAPMTPAGDDPADEDKRSPVELYLVAHGSRGADQDAALRELERRRLPANPIDLVHAVQGVLEHEPGNLVTLPAREHEQVAPPESAAARKVTRKGYDTPDASE